MSFYIAGDVLEKAVSNHIFFFRLQSVTSHLTKKKAHESVALQAHMNLVWVD